MSKKDTYLNTLHLGAKASTHEHAKELRAAQTEAEQKLWSHLRNKQLNGKKFRRQHALADFVVDFYCHECKLAIELDGNDHKGVEAKEYDRARTKLLNDHGITVLRFWNEEVIKETEKVLEKISSYLWKLCTIFPHLTPRGLRTSETLAPLSLRRGG